MKVSRALVTLSCLAVPVAVAVEECFYLDFSLVSLGAVAEMSIYIFATVSMLPHAPPFPPCHSLFSAVQASALNLPVERHTYTWTKWSSSSNKNNSKRRRRTEAIERNENNYESRAKASQARAERGEFPQLVAISNAIALKLHTRQSSRTGGRAAGLTWSKCSGHYICYRFRLSDKMIIKMLLRLHLREDHCVPGHHMTSTHAGNSNDAAFSSM